MISSRFRRLVNRFLTPERTLILSFLAIILAGTWLLYLPYSAKATPASFIDALFTASSAVCVTGLIVVDTGSFYSHFGQVVILILIQVGGLGIMTFSVFFYLLLGRSVGFRDRRIIQDTLSRSPIRNIYVLLKTVFLYTIVIELIGVLFLFVGWRSHLPLLMALYYSAFHAISAFCNAGFCLFSDSLVGFQENATINLAVTALIILGGIGFVVLKEMFEIRLRKNVASRISLHSEVVLITSITLIILGTLFIYFIERDNNLLGFSLDEQILISYFQSVTSRTAGFNSVPMNNLTNATCFILILLMFVGASPGSCGGGIKTTNLATLVSIAWNRYRGRDRTNLFRRTIPHETVARSISIILASASAVTIVTIVLLITQLGDVTHAESRGLFLEYLFETVSAFGTVGLSMGVTSNLVTLYLKDLKIENIYVKIISEDHGRALEKIGATEVIFPERDMAKKLAETLLSPNLLDYLPLSEEYSIVEIAPPKEFIGKTLAELRLRRKYNITILAVRGVIPEKITMNPDGAFMVKDSDILIALGKPEDIQKIKT